MNHDLSRRSGPQGFPLAFDAVRYDELLARAREAERNDQFGVAVHAYETALAALPDRDNDPRAADVIRFLGSLYRERGDTDRAERRYRESHALAERMGYVDGMAHAANWLGVIAMGRGFLAEASAQFMGALRLAGRAQNERLAGCIEQNLGILANIRGQLDAAVVHYRSALNQFRTAGDIEMLGLVLNNLGLLHIDLGQWDAAAAALDEAFDLAIKTANGMLENAVEINRAELHIAQSGWDDAFGACTRARGLAQMRGDRQREAEALKFLGVIARERDSAQVAERFLGEAAALAETCDDRLLMAEISRETGELHARAGALDRARVAFARASDLFQALGARIDHQKVRERLDALSV